MDLSAKLSEVIHTLVVQTPSFLVIMVCLIFSIVRWKRHPKVSLAVMIALALLIAHVIIFALAYAFIPSMVTAPSDFSTRETLYLVISFMYNLLLAVIVGVLLAGVFMQRGTTGQSAS